MTITLQAVNELIKSLESAGELSIKERKYLDIMRWAVGVAGERDAALNAERAWETAMMEVCGEDGSASVASEIRSLRALRDTAIQALNSQVEQLAAENVALKSNLMFWDADNPELPYDSPEEIASECSLNHNDEFVVQVAAKLPDRTYRVCESWESDCRLELVEGADLKTTATDSIVAGIKADGVDLLYASKAAQWPEEYLVEADEFAAQLRNGGAS
ncbi:hypothetical protein [Raoultella terrigena]|uniref:hypothetical protein n=1 Tax=Raoultella terrigena TaxID=577 RepID=UPI0030E4429F